MDRSRYPKGRFAGAADSGAADFQMTPKGGLHSTVSRITRTAKSKKYENQKLYKTRSGIAFTGNNS